jgi:membrane-associated phospholipid phosphatase/protein-S-isoprenylcysteine O-methyltransferase Ste14
MESTRRSSVGKILYALFFCAALPAGLVAWAAASGPSVGLPAVGSPAIGAALAACGALVMLSGMAALVVYGKGLPMNAYPPERYVARGVYRLTPHPIYTGFSLACVGVAVATGSAAGLWLVSPVVILGCVALVQGFEKQDLERRFPSASPRPLIALPADEPGAPSLADRLSVVVLVFLPWLLLYEAVALIGAPPDAVAAYLPFEHALPVVEWTEAIYASAYPFALLAPLVARTKRDLRRFAVLGAIATGLVTLLFVSVPLVAPPRPFEPAGWLGELLLVERAYDTPAAAFPSFHVVWALLAAWLYARSFPAARALWWGWAALVSASCVTTGMHAIVDVVGGALFFAFLVRVDAAWERARSLAERVANSWREWRVGPVRVINHGVYGGVGALVGLSIAGTLLGPRALAPMLVVAASSLVAAAIWAQAVEGSPSLLRPYGWYGGVLGALVGAWISAWLGADPWLLLAAFSVAAPWIQSAGRLRCLVQGCCHGREADARIGIRYTHPRSRVCRLAHLTGVPVHPTPLYSILWNVVVGILVARLWLVHAPLPMIVGVYSILAGLGRFVEESYRGEPQTPIRAGLRLYQWMAVASVVAGAILTTVRGAARAPDVAWNWESLVVAACFAVLACAALGVDFPESNRRFARLA